MELTRKQGGWVLADGKRASKTGPEQAVKALTAIDTTDLVTSSAKRFADFGVDADHGTHVVAKGQGKVLVDVVVGKHGEGGTFVRQGSQVYLVSGLYPSTFSKPAARWHHLQLFDEVKAPDVTKVEVHLHGQPAYTLVKKDKAFAFQGKPDVPQGFRFDAGAATSLVSTLVGARAATVLETDPGAKTTGLGDGADVITFEAGKHHGSLTLGAATKKGTVYARVGGRADVYTVSQGVARALRKAPTDLRDLHFVSLDPSKVTRLEIRHGKTHLVLAKTGGQWHLIPGGSGKAPNAQAVQMRLGALAGARGVAVATDPRHTGLDRPEGELVATLASGKRVTVRFGADTKTRAGRAAVFARGNADDAVYLVSPWIRDRLLGGPASFAAPHRPQISQAMLRRLIQAQRARQR